jgi:5-methylcytosine-specific restriction endonuclease McrA
MSTQVLVLDTSYIPVARIDWQRALTLLFMGKVEVVEEYEDKYVRSVTLAFKVPSIVRFIRAMRSKKKAIKFSRENVYTRDHGMCQYCGDKVPRASITYDHVIPRAQGGKTEWTNIVISCSDCNQKKGNRTPAHARMRLLSTPVRPKKLPDHAFMTIQWRKGDPLSWKDWLASHHYWNASLEEG